MKIYLVWGFLGSGKTTLIKHLLKHETMQGKRVVVLENESGRESIDGEMLRAYKYTVVDLEGGCMCCTMRMKLVETLKEIDCTYNPDIVLIESSGLASLEDIISIRGLNLTGVMTTIDVAQYDFLMKINPDFYRRQFFFSSVVFLTKTAQVDAQATESITNELLSLKPLLMVVADYRKLDVAGWNDVWDCVNRKSMTFIPAMNKCKLPDFATATINLPLQADKDFFTTYFPLLNRLFGASIIRAKGIIRVGDSAWMKFDFVNEKVELTELVDYAGHGNGFVSVWWNALAESNPCDWFNYFVDGTELQCRVGDLDLSDDILYEFLAFDKSNTSQDVKAIVDRLYNEALEVCQPRVGIRFVTGKKIDKEHLEVCGTTFKPSFIISKMLEKADFFVQMVSTVGGALDVWIERHRNSGDVMEAYVADAVGSTLAECIVALGQKMVETILKKWQLNLSNAYSPGYCDWNVKEQKLFFANLPERFCGVTLTESCLMLPIKSVSSFLGAGTVIEKKAYGCAICKNKNCYKRRI